jgi:hypothetical protein
MNKLKQDLLFLIAIRECYNLKIFLTPNKFRRKFLKALTVHKKDKNGEHWYIRSNVLRNVYNVLECKHWKMYGTYHREDGPACIYTNGGHVWYKDGKLHREDGPAIIRANGEQVWCKEDKLHREDGPAVIYPNGEQVWCKEGKLHRDDGPAVIYPNGEQEWFKDDKHIEPF